MSNHIPTRASIEASQLSALRHLIGVILAGNRFYGPRLRRAGINENLPSLAAFTQSMPLTTKAELAEDQAENPPFGSNLSFPVHLFTRFHQTSGSTGKPMAWLDTPESWSWMLGNWMKVLRAAGVTGRDRCFFAFSFGPFLGFWTAFEAASKMGCLCLPGGGMSSVARLQAMVRNEVTVLCSTPTYAIHLGRTAADAGIDTSKRSLKAIIVAGEPGGSVPAIRAEIERLWPGAHVYDHHGMTEVGPVSYQTHAHPQFLHIIEPAYLAEVLDPETLAPAGPGQPGELVLTTLGRTGSPLLRYRTGDLVRTSNLAPQTIGTAETTLEGGILGRADDMVIVRGVNLYPAAVEAVVRRFRDVDEFRVEINKSGAMVHVCLLFETAGDAAPAELAHHLARALHVAFQLNIEVKPVPSGSLPRFELKAKRWIQA